MLRDFCLLLIVQCVPRDENGKLNFHDIQNAINSFRKRRISNMKLLNPPVLRRDSSSNSSSSSSAKRAVYNHVSGIGNGYNRSRGDLLTRRRDMTNIAPSSMFRKMDGFSNAEITDEVPSHNFLLDTRKCVRFPLPFTLEITLPQTHLFIVCFRHG